MRRRASIPCLLLSLAVLESACEATYTPTFSSVDVSCTSGTDVKAGSWTFSSWVVDGDGADDVEMVTVTLLDFQGQLVESLPLARTGDTYWMTTLTEEELGIDCADSALYLYQFQASDKSGQTTKEEFTR